MNKELVNHSTGGSNDQNAFAAAPGGSPKNVNHIDSLLHEEIPNSIDIYLTSENSRETTPTLASVSATAEAAISIAMAIGSDNRNYSNFDTATERMPFQRN